MVEPGAGTEVLPPICPPAAGWAVVVNPDSRRTCPGENAVDSEDWRIMLE